MVSIFRKRGDAVRGDVTLARSMPIVAVSAVILANAAATLLPINGHSTGEISDLNPTSFTPAGYVFSIWALIYAGLLASLTNIRKRRDKAAG